MSTDELIKLLNKELAPALTQVAGYFNESKNPKSEITNAIEPDNSGVTLAQYNDSLIGFSNHIEEMLKND